MNSWLQAARLRTLPLAISGILMGSATAYIKEQFHWPVFLFGLTTAVLLQILSNYSNDYGDFSKGTDSHAGRADRMMASGKINAQQMKWAMVFVSVLCVASGISLLLVSKINFDAYFIFFLALGLLAVLAAIMYTVGKRAYGYMGLGDLFVMLFFGFVAVCGIHFLHAGAVSLSSIMAAIGVGALSTGVLNVNNIRDIESDKQSEKKTVAVRLGRSLALRYHRVLLITGFLFIAGSFLWHLKQQAGGSSMMEYMMAAVLFIPVGILLAAHHSRLASLAQDDRMAHNKELKALSLTTLLFALVYWIISFFYMGAVF